MYRGPSIQSLRGLYVFGDFGAGFVAALGFDEAGQAAVAELPFTIPNLVSFGEDNSGELYALAISGGVFKIVSLSPASPPPPGILGPPPSLPPSSEPAAPSEPKFLVRVKGAKVVAKGRVLKVRLRCSRKAMTACGGKLAIETNVPRRLLGGGRATLSLARGRFKGLAAGKKREYRLRLRKPAREVLFGAASPGRLRLTITVKARDNAGLRRMTTAERRALVSRR